MKSTIEHAMVGSAATSQDFGKQGGKLFAL